MYKVVVAMITLVASFMLHAENLSNCSYTDGNDVIKFTSEGSVFLHSETEKWSANCMYWSREFEDQDRKLFKTIKDSEFKAIITISCVLDKEFEVALTEDRKSLRMKTGAILTTF